MTQSITGTVERVVFHNVETGFCVLKVILQDLEAAVDVVGKVPAIHEGELVVGNGEWVQNKDYGKQFKAQSLHISPPTSKEGIERYLASGLIDGIGPELASRLVKAFGEDVFDVIEKQPKRLNEVSGIGKKRKEVILGAWKEQKSVRDIMVFLYSHGISTSRAVKIHKKYGHEAIAKLLENPYALARDFIGIGFKTADQIAKSLGVEQDSPKRIRAGIEFSVSQFNLDGHTAAPRDGLLEQTASLLGLDTKAVEIELDQQIDHQELIQSEIGEQLCLYLPPLHYAETRIIENLNSKLSRQAEPLRFAFEDTLSSIQKEAQISLAKSQIQALHLALTQPVSIITGGPGVGKTTILRCLLRALERENRRVKLCAPTGRAARRLSESTQEEATTIHRLLEFNPGLQRFQYDHRKRLECDALILDESSMVDLTLFHQLLRALPDHASLTLVGDADQLPSVGPGQVLGDLINSQVVPTAKLTTIFRQSAQSEIVENAHRIHQGVVPVPHTDKETLGEFYFIEAEDPSEVLSKINIVLTERIPKRFQLNPIKDVQILTPMHKSQVGVKALNTYLQELLNPPGKAQIERYNQIYRLGDKVMQLENDYDREVFNGDLGYISSIDEVSQSLLVDIYGRQVRYAFTELDQLTPAYACTIHKSQGSEYPAIIIPLVTQHFMMLLRKVLYTAVTRAKRLVIIIGSRKALEIATQRDDQSHRISGLRERLQSSRLTP